MSDDAYKLVVGVYLKDQTVQGVKAFQQSMEKVQKQAAAVQEKLNKIGANTNGLRNVVAAQEQINKLVMRRAQISKQIALTSDAEMQAVLKAEKKAIGLTLEELNARKANLSLAETTYAKATKFEEQQRRAIIREQEERLRGLRLWEAEQARLERNVDRQAAKQLLSQQRAADQQARIDQQAFDRKARQQQKLDDKIRSGFSGVGAFAAPAIASATFGGVRTGIHEGADLQTALATIQISTGASSAQVEQFRDLAFKIADQTAQTATQAAQNMAGMASSGISDPKQLIGLSQSIANFADVQYYKRGTSFQDSAQQGIQIAHLFNKYDQAGIDPILNKVNQISFAMPDGLDKFVTQLSYYEPVFRALGVKDQDSITAGALIDRGGLGRGKGGTALQSLVLNEMNGLALTKHAQGKRLQALQLLDLVNDDGSSKFFKWNEKDKRPEFDIIGALTQIDRSIKKQTDGLTGQDAAKKKGQMVMAVNAALGLTGERAALAITPEAIQNLSEAIKKISKSGDLTHIQAKYMNTLNAQFARFISNFSSLMTDLMWPWINDLTNFFKWLGDITHNLQSWMHKHKEAAKVISGALSGLGTIAALVAFQQIAGLTLAISGLGKAAAASEGLAVAGAAAGGGGFFARAGGVLAGVAGRIGPAVGALLPAALGVSTAGAGFTLLSPDGKFHWTEDTHTLRANNSSSSSRASENHTHNVNIHVHGSKDAHATAKQVSQVLIQHYKTLGSRSNLASQSKYALT